MILRAVRNLECGDTVRLTLADHDGDLWIVGTVVPALEPRRWAIRLRGMAAPDDAPLVGATLFPDDLVEVVHA